MEVSDAVSQMIYLGSEMRGDLLNYDRWDATSSQVTDFIFRRRIM
jgi:hypothetical protein